MNKSFFLTNSLNSQKKRWPKPPFSVAIDGNKKQNENFRQEILADKNRQDVDSYPTIPPSTVITCLVM